MKIGLIKDQNVDVLNKKIDLLLKRGWKLDGEIILPKYRNRRDDCFGQLLIKA